MRYREELQADKEGGDSMMRGFFRRWILRRKLRWIIAKDRA